jgi:hypothetical protein
MQQQQQQQAGLPGLPELGQWLQEALEGGLEAMD